LCSAGRVVCGAAVRESAVAEGCTQADIRCSK